MKSMSRFMLRTISIFLAMGLMAMSVSCDKSEPAYPSLLVTKTDFFIDDREGEARAQLLNEIRGADEFVDVAVMRLTDTVLAEALVAAAESGVRVRVVSDDTFRSDEGFEILDEAGIDVTFGDGELRYLPEPNISQLLNRCGLNSDGTRVVCPSPDPFQPESDGVMVRPSSFNLMSHNFALIDHRVVWNFSAPIEQTSITFAFRIDNESAWEAYWREFNQMHVGVFSTNLDVYNGPVKSSGQWSPVYITEHGEMMMRFGPQDRIVKTVIDDIYKARHSIWIASDSIEEEFLIDALEYKINARIDGEPAFDVRILLNDSGQEPANRGRLEDLGARFVENIEYLPTMAVIDARSDERRIGHVASHPLYRTGPFRIITAEPNDDVEIFRSDYFSDGVMWSMTAYPGQENPVLDDMVRTFSGFHGAAQ